MYEDELYNFTQDDVDFYYNVYKNNPNKENFLKLQQRIDPNYRVCDETYEPIFYYNTRVIFKPKKQCFKYKGKTYLTYKIILGEKYYLKKCEKAINEKFKNIKFNKTRVFNNCNEIAKYAFNIPDNIIDEKNKEKRITLGSLTKKYGEEEGKRLYEQYRQKQSYTNTFEYKNKKYGWSKEDFDEFNKSRAVTLNNLIQKHGEEKGKQIFDQYKEQQSYTNKLEYFIEEYGEQEGRRIYEEINRKKAHTLENYIRIYGDEQTAKQKLEEFYSSVKYNASRGVSKSSQIYFEKLDERLRDKYNTYYHRKTGEHIFYLTQLNKIIYVDYYIKELNLVIEYNGKLYHADPTIYSKHDKPNPFSNLTAEQIWERDNQRIKCLKEEYNIDVIQVWSNNETEIDELIKIIESYETRRN